ncbi:hypothetical protein DLE01_03660, partial [Streptomyces sp. FT05W]
MAPPTVVSMVLSHGGESSRSGRPAGRGTTKRTTVGVPDEPSHEAGGGPGPRAASAVRRAE